MTLRTILVGAALLAASQTGFAHGGERFARVVEVEPRLAFSFGSLYHDGFAVTYEVGGHRHVTYPAVAPSRVIVVPAPVRYEVRDDRHRWRHRHDRRDWRWDDDDDRGHRHGGRGHHGRD